MTRGFTLIETVVSLAIISMVCLAMGSVMLMAGKAVPQPDAPANLALDAADLLEQIASELQVAKTVSVITDKGIAFTVPDRDGDGDEESIVYLWGGVPGSALVRQYNGGATVSIAPSVYEFNLSCTTTPVSQADVPVLSAETLLDSFTYSLSYTEFPITQYNWAGQLLTPEGVPADAVDWNISRVLVRAKRHSGNAGVTNVQLRPAKTNGLPGTTVLESQTLLESNLDSNYLWETVTFSNAQAMSPDDQVCLVLQWQADNEAAGFQYSTLSGSGFLYTYTQNSGWSFGSQNSLYYSVYGTYTTLEPQPPVDVLESVTLTLNLGAGASSGVRSAVVALNQPEMP